MTNGDKIRNMSDEELAKMLYNVYFDVRRSIKYIAGEAFGKSHDKNDIEKWLKREAK